MNTSLGIHNVVSVTQEARDFGSFKCLSWVIEDNGGNRHEVILYSDAPLAVQMNPDRVVVEMPAELQEAA